MVKDKSMNMVDVIINRIWIQIAICLVISFVGIFFTLRIHPIGKNAIPYSPLDEFTLHLDKKISVLMKFYNIPGVNIALVKEGKLVWSEAYGFADKENARKMTKNTPMRVQSISKSVTAWGVMKLSEQGKIDLDAPISRYLKSWHMPKSKYSVEKLTIRHLLSHTGGLPLGDVFTIYSPNEKMPSLKEKLTQEAVLINEPGAVFSYSNTGYNLLELLIEEVTGQDFAEYMKQEILIPLNLRHSSYIWDEITTPTVPVGYDLNGRPVQVYVYPEKASGGLFATVEDIATFAIAGMPDVTNTPHILSQTSIKELYTPVSQNMGIYSLVFDAYSLGHYIETLPNNEYAISHGGQGTGIMTHFHAIPETGDAIVILTNSQRSWPLISYLLTDWAQWLGFSSVGMGRIIWGKYGLWAIIGLIWSIILLQLLRLLLRIVNTKHKKVQPKNLLLLCFIQISIAISIIGCLAWSLCQKYLFLSSVFPRASVWLGISAFALAIVLLLSALLFMKGKHKEGENIYDK